MVLAVVNGNESTFGPILKLSDSQFDNVGQDKRNKKTELTIKRFYNK